MSVCVEFQNRLHDLVEERELKRTQIVKEMGVDYRSFAGAFNYGILPKPVVLARMADYFCVPLAYLLGRSEDDAYTPPPERHTFHERLESLRAEADISIPPPHPTAARSRLPNTPPTAAARYACSTPEAAKSSDVCPLRTECSPWNACG